LATRPLRHFLEPAPHQPPSPPDRHPSKNARSLHHVLICTFELCCFPHPSPHTRGDLRAPSPTHPPPVTSSASPHNAP
jgi:hypothetical protein